MRIVVAGRMDLMTLESYLAQWVQGISARQAVAETVLALAGASIETSKLVAKGPLAGELSKVTARAGEFDEQKAIDVIANEKILAAMRGAPVAAFASEELLVPVPLNIDAPLLVATDPLDGSSNVDANISFGMIFSVLPRHPTSSGEAAFLRPGSQQLAAGFAVYGPATIFVLTVGEGTQIFTLDQDKRSFVRTGKDIRIPRTTGEYAINASNARYWDEPIRIYVHDCENGAGGPRGQDYNMDTVAKNDLLIVLE